MKHPVLVVLLLGAALIPGFGQDFSQFLESLDQMNLVQAAGLEVQAAEAALAEARAPGDWKITLQPQVSVLGTEVKGNASANLDIPLLPSLNQNQNIPILQRSLDMSITQENTAFYEGYKELFNTYSQAYLSQKDLEILQLSLSLEEQAFISAQDAYSRGTISYQNLLTLEEGLRKTQRELLETQMNARLTWYQLARLSGKEVQNPQPLEFPEITLGSLPSIQEITTRLTSTNPQLQNLFSQVQSKEDELKAITSLDFSGSLRGTVNIPQGAGSLTAGFSTTGLLSIGGSTSSPASPDWGATVSANLALSIGGSAPARRESVELEITQLRLQILQLEQTLAETIRTLYQKNQLNKLLLETAEAQLSRSQQNQEIIEERFTQGRATQIDRDVAAQAILKAELEIERAKIQLNLGILQISTYSGNTNIIKVDLP